MTLLAEIGEAVRGAIEDDVFPLATLHVGTDVIGEYGETTTTFVDHATTGFVADWEAAIALRRGYDANTAKIVLVQNDAMPKPKLGDKITATRPILETTETYRVTDVTSDPADATWQVAGVRTEAVGDEEVVDPTSYFGSSYFG
jgi:hypothetical protein